ncbi:MAG: hypothetical protein COA83_08875 [Methylophaga sp.]|nr:MAG: hypothetical protein COA83_08875 [Methylophaga sp.]
MEEDFDFSGDNDRRAEARRVLKDRRTMVRYEIDKDDRRSGDEQRKVKVAVKEQDSQDVDDEETYEEESGVDSVIGKIGKLFKR